MDFLVQIVPTATNNMLWPNLAKFRNLKSVIRKLCSHIIRKLWVLCNQEAMYQKGLPQKLVIWPDVQSAGVLLRSHKIQDSHTSEDSSEAWLFSNQKDGVWRKIGSHSFHISQANSDGTGQILRWQPVKGYHLLFLQEELVF